jgi:hypothetical protein
MAITNNCRLALLAVAALCLGQASHVVAVCIPGGQPCPPPGSLKAGFGPFKTTVAATTPVGAPPGMTGGNPHGKPLIADLGLTPGHKSVVFGNYGGQLWVVTTNGTTTSSILVDTLPADVLSTPAVGDLDGDGLPDVVVGYGSNFDGRPGGVRAFKNNGAGANPVFTLLWDHPSLDWTPPAGADPVFSSPAIGNLDGDGVAWVVWGSLDERIYCVKGSDGTQKAGWGPVPGNPTGGFWVGDTIYSSPALFDLDGDGKLDVIIGVDAHNQALMPQGVRVPSPTTNGGLLLAISASGTLLPGFPIQLDQAMSSSPAVGDIDGDGKPEIVVGTGNVFLGVSHWVYAFHCDGTPVLGWPVSVDGQVRTAPALADLDGDGLPDVVVTDDNSGPGPNPTFHVYAFKGTGVLLWKVQPKDFFGATLSAGDPVIADVLPSAGPEILVPTNGEVCVISKTGVQLTDNGTHPANGFSFFTSGSVAGVAVDDFESDGVAVEVVALAADTVGTKTDIWVWNTQATGLLPWGQFRHDAKHTGFVPGTPSCVPRAIVATGFYALTPCRVIDTRVGSGPLGGPALTPLGTRAFQVMGVCGIPAGAVSISANLTVTNITQPGELVVYPSDVGRPATSAISFHPFKTRANNGIVYLSTTSMFTVFNNSVGSLDFILDVNGYFQ